MTSNSKPSSGFGKRSTWIAGCTAVGLLAGVGCSLSETEPSAHLPPDQFFTVLALEHHAINLSMVAPYDTVTLHTTRVMGDGGAVPGDVVYSVSSPSLSVTNGVLKAESPVSRAVVRVTLTYGTITRTDSAIVSVIAGAPDHLRDFGLRVPAGDSAKAAMRVSKTLPLLRSTASGTMLSALLVSVVSSDSTIATVTQSGDEVDIKGKRPGRVVLSTATFAYGTAWRDSLVFTVGWPRWVSVPMLERFRPGSVATVLDFGYPTLTIGVGGCVIWVNESTTADADVQFENSSAVVAPGGEVCPMLYQLLYPDIGGHVAPFRRVVWDGDEATEFSAFLSRYRARVFSAPGVYPYRSTLHGTTGTVRVCDERNDTTCAPTGIGAW